jgi:hypothetical protein
MLWKFLRNRICLALKQGRLWHDQDEGFWRVLAPPPAVEPAPTKVYQLGEPMNFRVKKDFKRLFKSTAAQHDLKMNELLVEAFNLWMREKGR